MGKELPHEKGWWYARFRMRWPEKTEPAWHIDPLIAHKIIAPLINSYANDIAFWRFHRRAARDAEGHQFSFTFYASQEIAKRIFQALQSNILLKKLKKAAIISSDVYDDTRSISVPNIEDTSDGNWKAPIRKSWPFFIMGVCQMWLSLIDEVAESISQKQTPSSPKKVLSFYEQVNQGIKILWQEQGCHSLLHHLNAIFGYEPVLVRELHFRQF